MTQASLKEAIKISVENDTKEYRVKLTSNEEHQTPKLTGYLDMIMVKTDIMSGRFSVEGDIVLLNVQNLEGNQQFFPRFRCHDETGEEHFEVGMTAFTQYPLNERLLLKLTAQSGKSAEVIIRYG